MIEPMMTEEYLETELTEDVATQVSILACRCFTDTDTPVEERVKKALSAAGSSDPEKTTGRRFVIFENGKAIAHARTFVRVIKTDAGEIPVLALATVCTDPDLRGKGLGAKVTLKAFEQVGNEGWPALSLFQTPVPEFYAKLNCRLVDNRFVNRLNKEDPESTPWRDDKVMIYPADYSWPSGIIDLNGPDY